MDRLVLKGGNALALVHGIGDRTSVDLDYSLSDDVDDPAELGARMRLALEDQFRRRGLHVFDYAFEKKPSVPKPENPDWWGGYMATFKLISTDDFNRLGLEKARRQALESSSGHSPKRTFSIDISKHEYTQGRIETEIDHYSIPVYTTEMIALEKMRAICQQMDDYKYIPPDMKRARARDFYDIHAIVDHSGLNLAVGPHRSPLVEIFNAKDVPLRLLSRLGDNETYDFHRTGWPAVEASAKPKHGFRFYFDFVGLLVVGLEALWEEDSPL